MRSTPCSITPDCCITRDLVDIFAELLYASIANYYLLSSNILSLRLGGSFSSSKLQILPKSSHLQHYLSPAAVLHVPLLRTLCTTMSFSKNNRAYCGTSHPHASVTIREAYWAPPLESEPSGTSLQLDVAVNSCVPGSLPLAEKYEAIGPDFSACKTKLYPDGSACRQYHTVTALRHSIIPEEASRHAHPSKLSQKRQLEPTEPAFSRLGSTITASQLQLPWPKKRRIVGKASSNPATSKPRLPGTRVLNTNLVDITEKLPRGPKTNEQRAHAALIRRRAGGACAMCKAKKIKVALPNLNCHMGIAHN